MDRQKKAVSENYRVRISENVIKNLDEITGYIAFINREPINAVKVGDAIIATIERIERNPLAFRECEALRQNLGYIDAPFVFRGSLFIKSQELRLLFWG